MTNSQKPIILFDIDFTLFNTELFQRRFIWQFWSLRHLYAECVYPDVIPVLQVLKKNATLGIFSQAFTGLQKLKIEYSGLSQFFDEKHIYIWHNKKARAEKLVADLGTKHIAVVDDREDVARALAAIGVKIYLLDRNNNKRCPPGAKRISSLLELLRPYAIQNPAHSGRIIK